MSKVGRPSARAWALQQPQSNVRVVRSLFTDAINDGLHPGPNPFANMRLEQPRGRKDLIALTEPELLELGECALRAHGPYGPVFRAMIIFAAYVGLRPGELYALERSASESTKSSSGRASTGRGTSSVPRTARSGS